MGLSSVCFAKSEAQLRTEVSQLKDIPAIRFNPNIESSEIPFVGYAIGPQFRDAVSFDEQYQKGQINLKITNKEIKFGYSNEFHGLFIHLAPSDLKFSYDENKLLVFNNYIPGMIHVYRKKASDSDWQFIGETGSAVPYRKRLVKGLQLAVELESDQDESVYYFISRHSHHRFDGLGRVISLEKYKNEEQRRMFGYMIYTGALFSLIFFNLLIFISLKDPIYLYYCLSAGSVFFAGLSLTGFIDFLFSPFYICPSESLFVFTSLSLITSMYFASRFYSIRDYSKGITFYLQLCVGLVVVNLIAYLGPWNEFLGGAYLGLIIDFLILLSVIGMLAGGFISFRRGNTMAKFYLISWIFMFSGAFLYIGHFTGIIPRNFFTSHGVLWGNLLEMLIVSLGMAYKISILDREKKEALLLARGKKEYQRMVRVLLHDLTNPVSLVQYYVGLKLNRPDDFERKSSKAWDKINFGLTKLSEIISFHREQEIQINKLTRTVSLGPVLIREVLIEVELMFEEKLESKNLELILNGNLDVFVSAERISLINEVFNNLISNAIKFSPQGGKIKISVTTNYDQVSIEIVDEGVGFSDQQINLFENGDILESTIGTSGETGTGFGLSLVRGYMKVYNGKVSLYNSVGSHQKKLDGAHIKLTFNRV